MSGDNSLTTATTSGTSLPADVMSGLRELFDDEYEPMYRLAFTMVGSDRDAEEIVQDAFIGLAKRWADVANHGGYLRVSVVNGARKRIRSASRRADAESSLRVLSPVADEHEYLLDVVDALPPRQRTAVTLTYYGGLRSEEVGEILGCPAATVRSLVHRALDRMREEVDR